MYVSTTKKKYIYIYIKTTHFQKYFFAMENRVHHINEGCFSLDLKILGFFHFRENWFERRRVQKHFSYWKF